jgi:Raf kinase inhibitor-like YbhB/YbcL family protein
MALSLSSPDFAPNGAIPERFTCEGEDVSPALEWNGAPPGTVSLALVVDDPDAPDPAKPQRVWVHWVLYNVPPTVRMLPQGVTSRDLPAGARMGINDWGKPAYNGPCPPIGRHRYFFKLHALDADLPGRKQPTKAALERAMTGHVLATATLIGTYEKRKR